MKCGGVQKNVPFVLKKCTFCFEDYTAQEKKF
jgi:hypothetical protein